MAWLGCYSGSGYAIRPEFAEFDAFQRFEPVVEPTQEPKGCRCGDVLRGMMAPNECPLFRKVCTPENPVGPCMVSSKDPVLPTLGTCNGFAGGICDAAGK